jgi:hypothetical protein
MRELFGFQSRWIQTIFRITEGDVGFRARFWHPVWVKQTK